MVEAYLRRLHNGNFRIGQEIRQQIRKERKALVWPQRRLHNCATSSLFDHLGRFLVMIVRLQP